MANGRGKGGNGQISSCALKSLWMVTAVMKSEEDCFLESYDKSRQCIKEQRHHFANKGLYSQVFSVAMYGYESWAIKKAEH